MSTLSSEQTGAYYRAAILGLRGLDLREGRARRFGADADARWHRFCGKLHQGDRLQVLLRDASAPWGVAFAGAQIFQLEGVATDEPFGPAWITPNGPQALRYLAVDGSPTLQACAALLGISTQPVQLPELRPTTQLNLAGGAAILAAAEAFTNREDLDWARQVTVVADSPSHRQLAGLASVFVGAVKPCGVQTSNDTPPQGTAVVSSDAEPACAQRLNA